MSNGSRLGGLAAVLWSRAGGELLERIRALFGVLLLVNVVLVIPGLLAGGSQRGLLATVGLVGLAAVWVRARLRGDFCLPSRAAEPVLLLLAAWASPSAAMLTGVYYLGLNYGALYGSRSATLVRGVAVFLAFAGAHALQGGLGSLSDPTLLAHAWGAVLTSLVMALLAESVIRQQTSERAKDEFLSVVSHELRTPLTSMLGLLSTLDGLGDRLDADQQRHLVARALVNAERQWQLVEDLLNVSRMLDGALVPRFDDVDVAPLVEQTLHSLELDLGPVEIAPWHRVRVDPGHLRQILVNLMSNAIKYGEPPIEVTSALDEDGRSLVLRVLDHGPGVAEQFVPQLFERFSQESTGDRRVARGVGLGLWISHELARANGGELTYEPDQSVGACFALRLPAAEYDQQSVLPDQVSDQAQAPEGARLVAARA